MVLFQMKVFFQTLPAKVEKIIADIEDRAITYQLQASAGLSVKMKRAFLTCQFHQQRLPAREWVGKFTVYAAQRMGTAPQMFAA